MKEFLSVAGFVFLVTFVVVTSTFFTGWTVIEIGFRMGWITR